MKSTKQFNLFAQRYLLSTGNNVWKFYFCCAIHDNLFLCLVRMFIFLLMPKARFFWQQIHTKNQAPNTESIREIDKKRNIACYKRLSLLKRNAISFVWWRAFRDRIVCIERILTGRAKRAQSLWHFLFCLEDESSLRGLIICHYYVSILC